MAYYREMGSSGSCAVGLLACAVALSGSALTGPANACGNSVAAERASRALRAQQLVQDEDQFMAHLLLAEEQLRLNHLAAASDELDLIEQRIAYGSPRMRSRFWRSAALLTVRSQGVWPQVVMTRLNNVRQRANALERATERLRARASEAPDDPIRRTDLAEALASLPKYQEEARRILEDLARADLVTSAPAYAALVKLLRAAGDQRGAARALDSCRKLDATGRLCVPDVPST